MGKHPRVKELPKREPKRGSAMPLGGFRVVTLSVNAPGPAAAARLTELGARVVKVEPPGGDPLASYCRQWYGELNRGQKIVTLDLKQEKDRARLDRLLEKSDLLLTSHRPAALERLSLDWKSLHRRFPALCQVALVGYPAPRQHIAGHDLTYMAEAGLLSPPQLPATIFADLGSAERMASEALALLLGRQRSRKGAYREVSIFETARLFAVPRRYGITTADGMLGGGAPQYNLYRARRGWVAIAAPEPHFWKRLKAELQLPDAGRKQLAAALRKRTAKEWERWAARRDLPVAAVRMKS
jgi:alpha-methylacyl-CoA racemase